MALAELLAALTREAREAIDRQEAAARAEAEGLLHAARERAARRRDIRLAEAGAAARGATAEVVARERRQLDQARLASREALLDQVRARVEAELPSLAADSRYDPVFTRELEMALGFVAGLPVEVRAAPPQLDTARPLLAGRAHITLGPDASLAGGAMLQADHGRVEVDATLAGRLARHWPDIRVALARRIEEAP